MTHSHQVILGDVIQPTLSHSNRYRFSARGRTTSAIPVGKWCTFKMLVAYI